jgi:hypothetical protein
MFLKEESVHVCLKCGQHLPHYADCDAIVAPLTWSSLGSAGTHFMLGNTSDCDIYHHHQLLRRKQELNSSVTSCDKARRGGKIN